MRARPICICILFYGSEPQHFALAQKVLNAQMEMLASLGAFFVFGCNAVGAETKALIETARRGAYSNSAVVTSEENILKYPMMRRMFVRIPEHTNVCIWFDHDSRLVAEDVLRWVERVKQQLKDNDVLGSVDKLAVTEMAANTANALWGFDQNIPAYVPVPNPSWWASSAVATLTREWPPADLGQKLGHVLFGEFIRRRSLRLAHFRDDVGINVNFAGVEQPMPNAFLSRSDV